MQHGDELMPHEACCELDTAEFTVRLLWVPTKWWACRPTRKSGHSRATPGCTETPPISA